MLISADIVPEFNVPLSFPDHELWSIGAYEHVSAGGAFEENVRRPHTLYTHTPENPPLPIVFHGGSRLRGFFIVFDPKEFTHTAGACGEPGHSLRAGGPNHSLRAAEASHSLRIGEPGHSLRAGRPAPGISPAAVVSALDLLHGQPAPQALYEELRELCDPPQNSGTRLSDAFLLQKTRLFLVMLLQRTRGLKSVSSKKQLRSEDLRAVSLVAGHIDNRLQENPGLVELSKQVYMSPSKLKTLFKEVTGCTISSYRSQRRIYVACGLLAHTDLPVQEIARRCGYRKLDNFNILFEKHTGIMPRDYRRTHRIPDRQS